jgi:hypothetical protein
MIAFLATNKKILKNIKCADSGPQATLTEQYWRRRKNKHQEADSSMSRHT